jgi:cathepsin D
VRVIYIAIVIIICRLPVRTVSVDEVTDNLLDGSNSGIMGLAFSSIASTGATPFWETLASSNQFSSPEMSFWLTRTPDATQTEVSGGTFTLGGTNSSLFTGDIEFINMPVSTPSFWLLSMSGELHYPPIAI